jgi:heme/copper-type cytochrome/quinol oxidase subunit 4
MVQEQKFTADKLMDFYRVSRYITFFVVMVLLLILPFMTVATILFCTSILGSEI